MRENIYDREYLENYNFLIQDYRTVFDSMLDSGESVPEKVIKLENKRLIKQFKNDVKVARNRAKQKIKLEIKAYKQQKRLERKTKRITKMKNLLNKLKLVILYVPRLIIAKMKNKQNKKSVEPESSTENEK